MKGNIFSPEYIVSNAIALLLLGIVFWRPFTARVILSVIFLGAAIVNGVVAIYRPQTYLNYADVAALPAYENFILGYFSHHITLIVCTIAVLQLLAGVFMTFRNVLGPIALAGAAFFLVAIAPLGAGAAFPCSILLALSCIILIFSRRGLTAGRSRTTHSVKHVRQHH